jgi:RNA polymerase sigma factor (sigma-70 family)
MSQVRHKVVKSNMEEQQIIEMVQQGNANAYSYLVNKYQDIVFSIALKVLKNREDAEEMAQETFIKAYRSIKSFQGKAKFSTWLYSITYNTCITYTRKKKPSTTQIDNIPIGNEETEESFGDFPEENRARYLELALQQLPEDEYTLVVLYYYDDQSIEEICRITGLSESNAKVKLFRTRKKLHGLISELKKKEIHSQV